MQEPVTEQQMKRDYLYALYKSGLVTIHEKQGEVTPIERVHDFARSKGIPFKVLMSRRRDQHTAHARQDCMAMLNRNTQLSMPAIGRLFGRDHTTVLHGIRASKRRASA